MCLPKICLQHNILGAAPRLGNESRYQQVLSKIPIFRFTRRQMASSSSTEHICNLKQGGGIALSIYCDIRGGNCLRHRPKTYVRLAPSCRTRLPKHTVCLTVRSMPVSAWLNTNFKPRTCTSHVPENTAGTGTQQEDWSVKLEKVVHLNKSANTQKLFPPNSNMWCP